MKIPMKIPIRVVTSSSSVSAVFIETEIKRTKTYRDRIIYAKIFKICFTANEILHSCNDFKKLDHYFICIFLIDF